MQDQYEHLEETMNQNTKTSTRFIHLLFGTDPHSKKLRLIAFLSGFIASLMILLFPFLPVHNKDIHYGWPNNGTVENLSAPPITLVPLDFHAHIPCAAINDITQENGLILGTLPSTSPTAFSVGLFVRRIGNSISITDRSQELVSFNRNTALSSHCSINIESNYDHTRVEVADYNGPEVTVKDIPDHNLRPQVTGLYTETTHHKNQLTADVHVDTRWETTPSALKLIDGALAIIATIISLVALWKLDRADGRKQRRFPIDGWKLHLVDVFVISILFAWIFFGANTSDDGYLFTMARQRGPAHYMVNFFRWWGASEDPFGWYYNILYVLAQINPAAWFMRLPTFFLGTLCWLLVSKEILPRLGKIVRNSRAAHWSAAIVLLLIWLPLNNGLRPEPEVTASALLVWCLLERTIASAKILPLALATLTAAFTIGEAPGGTISIAVLIVCSTAILKRTRTRWTRDGILPLIMPVSAAGLSILLVSFIDQPLGVVLDGVRAKAEAGPSLHWWDEPIRFYLLVRFPDVDGSLTRKIGIYAALLCWVTIIVILIRRHRINGLATGTSWRLIGIMAGIMIAMMLTPTKWVHHYGVYASFGAALAGLAAALIHPSQIKTPAKRVFYLGVLTFIIAMAFQGSNGWWFISSYKVPWNTMPPQLGGIELKNVFFFLTLIIVTIGLIMHLSDRKHPHNRRPSRLTTTLLAAPIALSLSIILAFEISSIAYATWRERNGFSWLSSNIADLQGNHCALADKVLVEAHPNTSFLHPIDHIPAGTALAGQPYQQVPAPQLPSNLNTEKLPVSDDNNPATGNSDHALPFDINTSTPLLSSYGVHNQFAYTSAWYHLPTRTNDTPLVVITAAGNIKATLLYETNTDGGSITIELGHRDQHGHIHLLGTRTPIDIGPNLMWRNLRFPTAHIPAQANVMRVVSHINNSSALRWIAYTPPRLPHLITAQQYLGDKPGLIDWLPGLAFPCQQEIQVHNGIMQTPTYRLLPDYSAAKGSTNTWQNGKFGGPLGNTYNLLQATSVPTYLTNNWALDWGMIQKYAPLRHSITPTFRVRNTTHWGLWLPNPLRSVRF